MHEMHLKRIALLSLVGLVVQNTSLVILLKLSFRDSAKPYEPTSAVLAVEVVKLICCSFVLGLESVQSIFNAVLQIREQWMLFIPSMLYVVQNNMLFYGAQRLSPIVYIVCSQTKILTTAFVSYFLLGTKLTLRQCMALTFLVCGVVIVQGQESKQELVTGRNSDDLAGVLAVMFASLTSGLAGVLLEIIFKEKRSARKEVVSIWARNIQLSLISLPFALAGTFSTSKRGSHWDLFTGFDAVVASVILLQALGGIITAYVLKFANNILKCLAVSISICCCAAYSVANGELDMTPTLAVGVFTVNMAVFIFSVRAGKEKDTIEPGKQDDSVA